MRALLFPQVRVLVDHLKAPDFDSGWRAVKSQFGFWTNEFFQHRLNEVPFECKQYIRAVDGPLAGMVFEGRGDGMRSDQNGRYGGSVFGWDNLNVMVLIPSYWTTSNGFSVRDYCRSDCPGFSFTRRVARADPHW